MRPGNVLSTSDRETKVSFRGRDKLDAIVPFAISSDAADSGEVGVMVGRNSSTITAMTASGLTTLLVNTTLIWQRIVSVRGRDRLDTRVLGAISLAAAVLVEIGGLGA